MFEKHFIELTGCDLRKLVKGVYKMSEPQGLGYFHFLKGHELSEEEVDEILNRPPEFSTGFDGIEEVVYMDYVRGRCCKFQVVKKDGKFYTRKNWYDHTPEQLQELIKISKNGSFSMKMLTKDGRSGEDLHINEVYKVWSMLARTLSESEELSPAKRDIAGTTFDLVRRSMGISIKFECEACGGEKIKAAPNIIDLNEHKEEILFSSLTIQEQEDYLIVCDEEMKQELMKEGAMIPKPITFVLGIEK